MSAPTLTLFLTDILASLRSRNGVRITDLIQLDITSLPPAQQQPYIQLNQELNNLYPSSSTAGSGFATSGSNTAPGDEALSRKCRDVIPSDEFGSFFAASFAECLVLYFRYVRDFARMDNVMKAGEIRGLTGQCITALGDSKYGAIMIPIVLSFSRTLAAVAANLDRNPTLLHQQQQASSQTSSTTTTGKISFVEDAANVLRDAFIKCLAGSPGVPRTSSPSNSPNDKRTGIYLTANSCLKLLFQCRKLRNAQQMFLSIDAQSPPLEFYPAAQRVTYLYYLGRYHFANNHFFRAQKVLSRAYEQCHRDAGGQRRAILVYLMASNLCLGRLPTRELLNRREAQGELADRFGPLIKLIKRSDLGGFRRYLDLEHNSNDGSSNSAAHWFLKKRILLQIRNRCEVLIWRGLIRRVFIISGWKGEERKVPFLRLSYVQVAARWSLSRSRFPAVGVVGFAVGNGSISTAFGGSSGFGDFGRGLGPEGFGKSVTSRSTEASGDILNYVDPDLEGVDLAIAETGFDPETGYYNDSEIDPNPTSLQSTDPSHQSPTMYEVESIFTSLIQQGLLRGFVLHANPRFAIPGSQKAGGPLNAGFPNIWGVVQSKAERDGDVVPGLVRMDNLTAGMGMATGGAGGGASMAGRVVRLSGARPVGAGS